MEREKVQAYDMSGFGVPSPDPDGEWVKASDYDQLLTALEASEARVRELETQINRVPNQSILISLEAKLAAALEQRDSTAMHLTEHERMLAAAERERDQYKLERDNVLANRSDYYELKEQIKRGADAYIDLTHERDTLRARCEALTHALQDMIALSAGLNDDDEYLGEAQNAGPRIDLARRILAESPTPTDSDSAPAS